MLRYRFAPMPSSDLLKSTHLVLVTRHSLRARRALSNMPALIPLAPVATPTRCDGTVTQSHTTHSAHSLPSFLVADLDHPEDNHLVIVEDAEFVVVRIHTVLCIRLENKATDEHEVAKLT